MSDAHSVPIAADLRSQAAGSIRALAHAFVAHEAEDTVLQAITTALEPLTERLRSGTRKERPHQFFTAPPRPGGTMDSTASSSPFGFALNDRAIGGEANPFSVDGCSRIEGEEAVTIVTLQPGFEGAPGRAHGGVVAAIFDDVAGHVLSIARTPAFTGSLTVRYHAPTRMEVPLTFRARLVAREGRRLHVSGDCWDGATMVTSCEAVFITVEPLKLSIGSASAASDD